MDALELLRRVPKRVQVAVTAADGRLRWRKAAFWRQIPHDHPRRVAIAARLTRMQINLETVEYYKPGTFSIPRYENGTLKDRLVGFVRMPDARTYAFKYVILYYLNVKYPTQHTDGDWHEAINYDPSMTHTMQLFFGKNDKFINGCIWIRDNPFVRHPIPPFDCA